MYTQNSAAKASSDFSYIIIVDEKYCLDRELVNYRKEAPGQGVMLGPTANSVVCVCYTAWNKKINDSNMKHETEEDCKSQCH